jgi:hypothetical protein
MVEAVEREIKAFYPSKNYYSVLEKPKSHDKWA